MITVVGGVYQERCMHPQWREIYGSAGRAASALVAMDVPISLHCYTDAATLEVLNLRTVSGEFEVVSTPIARSIGFEYAHGLSVPSIFGVPKLANPSLQINSDYVIRFGMLEGDAVVDAKFAVYDPQNLGAAIPFAQNGSRADHLALILNLSEARQMSRLKDSAPENIAQILSNQQAAEVVVIKMGARGALVWANGTATQIPAFRTSQVWKIGSGDCFVAHFAQAWMQEKLSPTEAAIAASKATAYYCETQGFPTKDLLKQFVAPEIILSKNYSQGRIPKVYLAGPFFSLAQRWMIEQARTNLIEMGMSVFSPFHDVGHGSADDVVEKDIQGIKDADILFAVGDGMDAGTLYEIGYARAINKPVVMYCENESEEDKKMMSGSGCVMCKDYTTAIYTTLWEAAKL